jgi:hypothetical protein
MREVQSARQLQVSVAVSAVRRHVCDVTLHPPTHCGSGTVAVEVGQAAAHVLLVLWQVASAVVYAGLQNCCAQLLNAVRALWHAAVVGSGVHAAWAAVCSLAQFV